MGGDRPLSVAEAHPAGLCDVAHISHNGTVHLVTCGQDGKLCYRSAEEPSKVSKAVEHTISGGPAAYTCVAVSAKGVVVGDVDNFVKIFSFPEGEFKNVVSRFTLPVQAVAFAPSGATLAAGGDDEGIKLISTADNKVIRTLKAQPYTRGLAFDPKGEYVASASADGMLSVWNVVTGKAEMQLKKACPKLDVASIARCRPAWHPDGGALLAAPGTDKDILFYERLSWEQDPKVLAGEHSANVSLVAFSNNGLYLASAAGDQSVVVWDLEERKALGKRVLAGAACGLSWHPAKNQLAIATEDGEVAVWDGVVPSDLPDPNADPDVLAGVRRREGAAAGEDVDPSLLEGGMTGEGFGGSDDYDREDSFIADEDDVLAGHHRAGGKRRRGGLGGYGGGGHMMGLDLPAPQDPIQPGSTQLGDGVRRYLAYTPLGCIVLKAEEDHNTVEVSFHDTAKMRRRIPLFKDFYNLGLASLGEKGALYASKSNTDSPSTVLYQPFESWAPNSDWAVGLPSGEEAECVAAGQAFCAVATSRRLLRIFSQAGLQRSVITLAGAPVALAAQGHQLAAVWHAAAPTPAAEQQLAFAVYDVAEQRELASGRLPLTPGATLAWLGFSEEGLLAAYDSEGELRLRAADFGGSWVPLFSATAERKATETFWVFGLTARQLQCIVLNGPSEPAVPPPPQRPLVSTVPLRAPVVGQEAVLGPIEADVIRHGVLLSHLAAAREEGGDAAEHDLGAQQLEADKLGLKLVAKLIQSDRHARALEAASQLHTMQALEGALRLANQLRARTLADRLSAFIEQRLALEAAAAAAAAAEQERDEEEQYRLECQYFGVEPLPQGEAVTPVAAPACPASEEQPAGPSPSAGAKSSRASPPRQQQQQSGSGAVAGPFARKPVGQNAAPNPNAGGGAAGGSIKRKAPAANPFARKSKAAKG